MTVLRAYANDDDDSSSVAPINKLNKPRRMNETIPLATTDLDDLISDLGHKFQQQDIVVLVMG